MACRPLERLGVGIEGYKGQYQVGLGTVPLHAQTVLEQPVLPVTAWGNPHEAMRYLKAGRHNLAIVRGAGQKLDQLVVRAIPALLFDYYDTQPHVGKHGPWDWEFIGRHMICSIKKCIEYQSSLQGHLEASFFE